MDSPSKGCEFRVDREKRLLTFRLWGLWDEQTVSAFQDGFRENLETLGPGPFCVYVDVSEFPPQRADIGKGGQKMMALATKSGMTKAAHLVGKAMTELQIKRLAAEVNAPEFRFFKTEKEALDWLSQSDS
jgi:hypothetical protein